MVLNVLRNVYEGLTSCVRTPEGLTDYTLIVLG